MRQLTHIDPDGQTNGEVRFAGVAAAPGIAIAPAALFSKEAYDVEQRTIDALQVDDEVARFERAVQRADRDLSKISSVAREKIGEKSAEIFDAQRMMLHDTAVYEAVCDAIRTQLCNADYAITQVMDEHGRRLESSGSEYLRERAGDLSDVRDRVIRHLRRGKLISAIDDDSIVVAENLTAADIVLFSRRGIRGAVTDFGGATSHVSIMARALGVPAVVGLHGVIEHIDDGDLLILDGLRGHLIVRPTPETVARYRAYHARYNRALAQQDRLVPLAAETTDGHAVGLMANLEFREELPLLERFGAHGIGLFRTEMLFLMQGRVDYTEDDQVRIYRDIVQRVAPKPTTFRLLDLGGDKMLPLAHREHNPFLGWRGVRILLDKPDLLVPQLRALLRASRQGPMRLLLPMVTEVGELRRLKALVSELSYQVELEDGEPLPHVPLGIMVEVPSVALQAARFAKEVDFFSLGTNDLTQYTLAVDRGNDLVAHLYQALHPAVLRLIALAASEARAAGIPVSLCGELAASPRAVPILVGLGVDELSASPAYLLEIKRVLRSFSLPDAQAVAKRALDAADAEEVDALVTDWLHERGCHLIDELTDAEG